jgi:hypothetical protein
LKIDFSPFNPRNRHISLLCDGLKPPTSYLEGISHYLLGRLYQGWSDHTHSMHTNIDNFVESPNATEQFIYKKKSFENFCIAVRPKFLPMKCVFWAEAHHRKE